MGVLGIRLREGRWRRGAPDMLQRCGQPVAPAPPTAPALSLQLIVCSNSFDCFHRGRVPGSRREEDLHGVPQLDPLHLLGAVSHQRGQEGQCGPLTTLTFIYVQMTEQLDEYKTRVGRQEACLRGERPDSASPEVTDLN